MGIRRSGPGAAGAVVLCNVLLDQPGDVRLVGQDVAADLGGEQQPDEGRDAAAQLHDLGGRGKDRRGEEGVVVIISIRGRRGNPRGEEGCDFPYDF